LFKFLDPAFEIGDLPAEPSVFPVHRGAAGSL
jgi:hypothetical protein